VVAVARKPAPSCNYNVRKLVHLTIALVSSAVPLSLAHRETRDVRDSVFGGGTCSCGWLPASPSLRSRVTGSASILVES
jgi:hypothetical protein